MAGTPACASRTGNPPSWLFAPVWTALYVLMGVAAWLVARRDGSRTALGPFGLQLVLNGAWTPIFFGLRRTGLAFAEIVAMAAAIALTIVSFARHSRVAALLPLPYLAWVAFAATLNGAIWRLNRR